MKSDNWKKWLAIFLIGVVLIVFIRNRIFSDGGSVGSNRISDDECFELARVDGRVPDHVFCDQGTVLTSPFRLRSGLVKLSMSASRPPGAGALCRVDLIDSEGQDVSGSYNGILLRGDVLSDSALWATRVGNSGDYIARVKGPGCRWVLGISQ